MCRLMIPAAQLNLTLQDSTHSTLQLIACRGLHVSNFLGKKIHDRLRNLSNDENQQCICDVLLVALLSKCGRKIILCFNFSDVQLTRQPRVGIKRQYRPGLTPPHPHPHRSYHAVPGLARGKGRDTVPWSGYLPRSLFTQTTHGQDEPYLLPPCEQTHRLL